MRAGVTWLDAQQHASTSCSAWPQVATQHTCGLRPRNSRRVIRPRGLPHDTSTQHGRRLRSPPTIRAVAAEVETAEAELLTTEGLGDQSDAGQLALLNLAATCSRLEQQLDALPVLGLEQPSGSITVSQEAHRVSYMQAQTRHAFPLGLWSKSWLSVWSTLPCCLFGLLRHRDLLVQPECQGMHCATAVHNASHMWSSVETCGCCQQGTTWRPAAGRGHCSQCYVWAAAHLPSTKLASASSCLQFEGHRSR